MTHITLPRETVQHIIEILPDHATFTKNQLRTALEAAPAAREPMTHDQAKALRAKYGYDLLTLIRETEAHHGIGKEQK